MASQASLDMRHRDGRNEAGEGASERARRITLDDEQVGPASAELRRYRGNNGLDVRMRILCAGAAEPRRGIGGEIEFGRIEIVLASQDQRWANAALGKRSGHWGKLNCFGSGADDQFHVRRVQRSPYFGGSICIQRGGISKKCMKTRLAEVVGVGLEFEFHRAGGDDVNRQAVAFCVAYGGRF